ncbi:MAG: seg [Candidatus Paceibacter sp.]|jgi:hypothetical protein|nr:seg [Candidatus Paceibacter sp.]
MSNLKKVLIIAGVVFVLPFMVQAANIYDLKSLIYYVIDILNAIIPLLFAIAFLTFIWGIIKYIYAAGPQKLNEGRNYIIYGVIAMTVMVSVWGIAEVLKNTFFESAGSPGGPSTYTTSRYRNTRTDYSSARGTGNPYWPF